MHQFLMTQIRTKKTSELLAPFMFTVSFSILMILAALVVVWVEIPRYSFLNSTVDADHADAAIYAQSVINQASLMGSYLVIAAWALGTIIVCEVLIQHFLQLKNIKPDNAFQWRLASVAQMLCPPLRLAAPNLEMEGQVWLPALGWQRPGRKLFKRLQNRFSRPMLFFALLILPVLLIEFGLRSVVEQNEWLRLTLHVCTGVIWCAFAVEFIVLLNVSDRKFDFVKKHWIDLAIILLPIVMFLRSLRALQVLRVSKFAKLQQLTNLSRVYRVRGVAMKALRALMMLEIVGRVIPVSLQRKLRRLQREMRDKKEDMEELQSEIEKVKAQIALEEAEKAKLEEDNDEPLSPQDKLTNVDLNSKEPQSPLYQNATTSENSSDEYSV